MTNDETLNGQDHETDTSDNGANPDVAAMAAEAEGAQEGADDTVEELTLEARIIELEGEVARLNDQVLRERAETANVRRRADKDKSDASQYAVTSFAREMLTVADNLSRALTTLPEDYDQGLKPFVEGVDMTGRELSNIFDRFGIKAVTPQAGEKFDPKVHQAMFEVPTDDHPVGSVVQVVATGYVIKDRLLRPAMVGVAKGNDPAVDTEA